MSEEVGPEEINEAEIGEAFANVAEAVKAYVEACAPYPISARKIESNLIKFVEQNVEEWLDRAREE